MTGSDEVLGAWAERIYYDKAHKKLAYARHYLVLRTGASSPTSRTPSSPSTRTRG